MSYQFPFSTPLPLPPSQSPASCIGSAFVYTGRETVTRPAPRSTCICYRGLRLICIEIDSCGSGGGSVSKATRYTHFLRQVIPSTNLIFFLDNLHPKTQVCNMVVCAPTRGHITFTIHLSTCLPVRPVTHRHRRQYHGNATLMADAGWQPPPPLRPVRRCHLTLAAAPAFFQLN